MGRPSWLGRSRRRKKPCEVLRVEMHEAERMDASLALGRSVVAVKRGPGLADLEYTTFDGLVIRFGGAQ